ncbi:carboxypeptidase-like regulatory domain-containing protein [Hymenobacter armeniacus]|uniref:Carboxypeptidase-like regulatory domain-containing protein n=1 Tax=Hymenobacter armeniacus TaxID=2771358 RepID=A0ABR8JSC7_9BACT|nr:carboxypeptidase-like regulatory domain-containing protein [Hymenobacter armeniacus]MBD2721525.1 carboxypeptidase-like regulatory domain-containing protein [Hymenobacter armeniacus]
MRVVWPPWSQRLALLAVLWLLALGARAQAPNTVRLSGSVAEAGSRLPVPGATVQVQRTRRGVVTDAAGNFGLDVLPTDTVLFRALGFKTQRMAMGGTGLSQLVVRIQLKRDSVQLGEVQVVSDRADRAVINRALRNIKRPKPPVTSAVKRPPKPKPLFAVDSAAPKAPVPTIQSPVSLIYDQFSREGKQRRKMEEIEAELKAEKLRKARAEYNKAFKDNRGYEP